MNGRRTGTSLTEPMQLPKHQRCAGHKQYRVTVQSAHTPGAHTDLPLVKGRGCAFHTNHHGTTFGKGKQNVWSPAALRHANPSTRTMPIVLLTVQSDAKEGWRQCNVALYRHSTPVTLYCSLMLLHSVT